jgi:hypothetical protein
VAYEGKGQPFCVVVTVDAFSSTPITLWTPKERTIVTGLVTLGAADANYEAGTNVDADNLAAVATGSPGATEYAIWAMDANKLPMIPANTSLKIKNTSSVTSDSPTTVAILGFHVP